MTRVLLILLATVACPTLFCLGEASEQDAGTSSNLDAKGPASEQVPNHRRVSDRIHCGGTPVGDEALSQLVEMGIRTIVSVDAAKPNIEHAKSWGLRYVHIPIGYDGIDSHARRSLVRLVREVKSPIFIHCHHGVHRGPVAAAIAGLAAGDLNQQEALKSLEEAGTSKVYDGLWDAVAEFRVPPADAELPPLVETAPVRDLAARMAEIDRYHDTAQRRILVSTESKDDVRIRGLEEQALLLRESFHELRRIGEFKNRSAFDDWPLFDNWISRAETEAKAMQLALNRHDIATAARHVKRLSQTCVGCHQRFRD